MLVEREKQIIEALNDLSERIHKNALNKKFWDGDSDNIGQKLMLVVSEASEALEAHRINNHAYRQIEKITNFENDIFKPTQDIEEFFEMFFDSEPFSKDKTNIENNFKSKFEEAVKDTFEDELADIVIRVLDLSKRHNINIGAHIFYKRLYNSYRPEKHGKMY